ncbi:MAG: 5-carboxymethyl-2-hydroxymuconate Delta-isomerase [Fimbriimonadales bacterium]
MPHIILETTADLFENAHIPDILEGLVDRLSGFESIDPQAVKAYHTLRSNWCMGRGAPAGFAHCTVGLLEGRSDELKQAISNGMYEELRSHFSTSLENNEVSLTLELREFDAQTYRK